MNTKPEPLHLADWCEILARTVDAYDAQAYRKAASELRRLHEENERLKTAPPAATVQDDLPDFIAGAFGVSRGTAYDMMREALKEAAPVQEPVTDSEFEELLESYWNIAYSEGKTGKSHGDKANEVLSRLRSIHATPPAAQPAYDQTALELCEVCGWKTLIPGDVCLNCEHEAKLREKNGGGGA